MRSPAPTSWPLRVRRVDRRGHRRPRIEPAERRVGPGGHRDPGVHQRTHAVERVAVVGVDLAQVVVAALGDEMRLGHDGDVQAPQVGEHLGGDHRPVFDPVTRARAGRVERGDRDDELEPGHTVERDRTVFGVRGADRLAELVDRRQRVVVEHDLDRAECGAGRIGRDSRRPAP